MKENFKRNLFSGVLIGLACAVALSFARFDAKCDDLRQNLLRLHVIANSDSEEDQQLKLKVRDEVLSVTASFFEDCTVLDEALYAAQSKIEEITNVANRVITQSGFDYRAQVSLEETYFETREYDDFTLPAGNYNSLVVRLGEAKGKNWWCVVFPCVCVPAASNASLSDGVSKQSAEMAENAPKYIMKFKFAEIYEDIKRRLDK